MAREMKKKPVKITYAAIGAGSAPVWVAYEAGIMDRNGLDAEVFMIRGSGAVSEALLNGKADFGNCASPMPLQHSFATGRDIVYLTGGINYMVQTMVVRPEIETLAGLKGKTLGKSGGDTDLDDLLLEMILPKAGVDPHKDLRHALIKNQPDALEKLKNGTIDGALFTPPWLFAATKAGFRVVMDAMDIMLDYQLGGLIASRALIQSDPDLVRRAVKSYVEGVHHYKRYPDFAVDVFRKYSKIEDRDIALKCHAQYVKFFGNKPYPSLKGLQTVLTHLSHRIPEAAKTDPARFVDNSFLKELDDSGFIDELYEREPV